MIVLVHVDNASWKMSDWDRPISRRIGYAFRFDLISVGVAGTGHLFRRRSQRLHVGFLFIFQENGWRSLIILWVEFNDPIRLLYN